MTDTRPIKVIPTNAAARIANVQEVTIRKALGLGRMEVSLAFMSEGRSRKRYLSFRSFLDYYGFDEDDCLRVLVHSALVTSHTGREFLILSDFPEVVEVTHV